MSTELKSIDDYFREHGKHHVRKAAQILSPLHTPGVDPLPSFDGVQRQPFEPQAHVINASVKMLDAVKRGIIVGEMGTGKTLMGQLAIHEHARRGVRKGGCNGNYRAIVLCPDHLIRKWKAEIEMTIPGAKVTLFDEKGKGSKVLVGELSRLRDKLRDGTGKWKKPDGPEWFILGRDQSKYLPARKPAVFVRKDRHGQEQHICPSCGKKPLDKDGAPIDVKDLSKLISCNRKYAVEAENSGGTCGLDRIFLGPKTSHNTKAGATFEENGKKWVVRECGQPLWTFVPEPRRWPPALFIHKQMRGCFRYLVIDEVHEQKSDESAQAIACGRLIASCRYSLALTGTLVGGYADHLFPLLFRFDPRSMREDGHEWRKQSDFTKKYGRIERIVKTSESDGSSSFSRSTRSMRRERSSTKESTRSVPGIMPALFGKHLIGKSVFLCLEDIAENLPAFTEYIGGDEDPDDPFWYDCRIEMSGELKNEYERIEKILVSENTDLLRKGCMKLLGSMLHTLLGYPDRPWDWKPLFEPEEGQNVMGVGYFDQPGRHPEDWVEVCQPENLPQDVIYPKEQALLDIVRKEVSVGNQVWVFVQMSGKRDIQDRLKNLLENEGIKTAIMRTGSVKVRARLSWMEKEGKKVQVVISNPTLVQTGVDFFGKEAGSYNFNSIVFYETGYNLFTLRQAARRAWRIGQQRDCRVYYLHYAGTMQQRAMQLMSRKMAAATALDGELNAEGLSAMAGDDGSTAMALARSLANNISNEDVSRNWAKQGGKPAKPVIIPFEPKLPKKPAAFKDNWPFDDDDFDFWLSESAEAAIAAL